MEKAEEFKAHEGEIEDLTLGPDGKVRKSVCGACRVEGRKVVVRLKLLK